MNPAVKRYRFIPFFSFCVSDIFNNNDCMYFGQLTAELHDALVEDPKPYRKDVKTLLANLLAWTQALRMEEVVIDKPSHSQRVRLVFLIPPVPAVRFR